MAVISLMIPTWKLMRNCPGERRMGSYESFHKDIDRTEKVIRRLVLIRSHEEAF